MSYELCEKIRDLKPYEPITGSYRIRLDANESFLELPGATKDDMLSRISAEALNRYPDPLASKACGLFAAYHGIDPGMVTAGNGSDELLSLLTQAFLMRGERLCVVSPEFSMYAFYGHIAETVVDTFKKDADFSLDPGRLAEFINQKGCRMLIMSNPCNPTGTGISREEMLYIVRNCPDCLIVADEAYMDFWDQSVIDRAGDFDNLFVLRTCSKAFRMAGIRCGFAVGNKTLTDALRAVKSPYNVSSLTQAAAEAILSRPDELRQAAQAVTGQRIKLERQLGEISEKHGTPFKVVPSRTNFVYIELPEEKAKDIFEYLKQKSIIIRCFGNGLRITAGSPEEQDELVKRLDGYFTEAGA